MAPSRISAPYGSAVQPCPGGTTSPWALHAIVGPPAPKRSRTTRFVHEIIPFALTSASGTGWRSTLSPSPSRSSVARLACALQSPGGLSEGTLTSSARKAVSAASCSRMKLAMASRVALLICSIPGRASGLSARCLGFEIAQDVEENARAEVGVLDGHGLGRVMAHTAVAAAHEQHADVGHVGYRHAVMPGAARKIAWLDAFGPDLLGDVFHDPGCTRTRMGIVLRCDHDFDLAPCRDRLDLP